MVFAFGSFALVVGLGGGVVLAGDERGDEHGVFEAVVTSAVLGDAVDAFAGSSVAREIRTWLPPIGSEYGARHHRHPGIGDQPADELGVRQAALGDVDPPVESPSGWAKAMSVDTMLDSVRMLERSSSTMIFLQRFPIVVSPPLICGVLPEPPAKP